MKDPKPAAFLSIGLREPVLCTRCGTCGGVCPTAAIDLTPDYYPRLNPDKCTACGLCGRTCPGAKLDYHRLSQDLFQQADNETFDGYIRAAYIGRAAENKIVEKAAGGGLVTALLTHLLQSGRVTRCVVCRMNPQRPWEGQAFLARTAAELTEAQGSHYTVIPVNRAFRELRQSHEPVAVVGLPCHIHGLRLMARHAPGLAERIQVAIGLFCGGTLEPAAARDLLRARGIAPETIKHFSFRDGEWPGQMTAELYDGRRVPLHTSNYRDGAYNYFAYLYPPPRCLTCLDGSARFADIAIADAWHRGENGRYLYPSHSRLLVRTVRGEQIVQDAVQAHAMVLQEVTGSPLAETPVPQTVRKGRYAPLRVARLRRHGRPAPEYDLPVPAATMALRVREQMVSAFIRLMRHPRIREPLARWLTSPSAAPLVHWRQRRKQRQSAGSSR